MATLHEMKKIYSGSCMLTGTGRHVIVGGRRIIAIIFQYFGLKFSFDQYWVTM